MKFNGYHLMAPVLAALPSTGLAQGTDAAAELAGAIAVAVPTDLVFIMNSFIMLIGGFLVFWMAAGFAMLETGLVRSKNAAMQLTKNVSLFATACFMYYLVGYSVMYPGDAWLIDGVFGRLGTAVLEAVGIGAGAADDYGYASTSSDFFFQVMFCATTASIVSGTLAERIRLWPFLAFSVVLTALIYPIQASWHWGGGFLEAAGFSDFAGSTTVHSVGGWAALTGAIILGPRLGRYKDGKVVAMPGSNLPLATLGTFILWLGWFGFNGASQLSLSSV
ncbi:MAG: ammonium transporter, partial [Gemmobacter sp.]